MTIFVSHSQRDTDYLSFLNKAFSTTPNVDAKYEEVEAIDGHARTADRIERDIQTSGAVFVLLTENVATLEHTRDWVAWECGVGSSKGVWVFEHPTVRPEIKIVIPKIHHYVAFQDTPSWLAYLRKQLKFLESNQAPKDLQFSNVLGLGLLSTIAVKHVLPGSIQTGAAMQAVLARRWAEDRLGRQAKEFGSEGTIRCRPYTCPKCGGKYLIHREQLCVIRCPICNNQETLSGWN